MSKKIINGKLYDTETATLIGSCTYGAAGDFSREGEYLYLKKTGEFFLYFQGGPMTPYGKVDDSGAISWGDLIHPCDEEEAKEWLVKHDFVDKYQELFREVEE